MTIKTGYVDPDERFGLGDFAVYVFKAGIWSALIILGYGLFSEKMPYWVCIGGLLTLVVIEASVLRLVYYGFRWKTRLDRWESIYYGCLSTRVEFNRKATFCWLFGYENRALNCVERADYAWLDAQIMLAEKDSFLAGEDIEL
ncbi:MAG: hypothetical protein ACREAN_07875 [Nitrosopumilaceae archaeon]